MALPKYLSVAALVLFVALTQVLFVAVSDHAKPNTSERDDKSAEYTETQGFIELLKANGGANPSVEATLQAREMTHAVPLRKEEADALLKILRNVSAYKMPSGYICVLFVPAVDSLTLTVDERGRKVAYKFDLPINRSYVRDRSTYRTYVVPDEHLGQLETLLAGVGPRRPLVARRPTEPVLQRLLSTMHPVQMGGGHADKPAKNSGRNGT
ncbi:MAG TPA: hypothetical protein VFG04_25280 [Planctomycetaceae bacterium]|jgi:hypothetical protein|nr:hypothetical protein [Planctomycetaceae bacterium]